MECSVTAPPPSTQSHARVSISNRLTCTGHFLPVYQKNTFKSLLSCTGNGPAPSGLLGSRRGPHYTLAYTPPPHRMATCPAFPPLLMIRSQRSSLGFAAALMRDCGHTSVCRKIARPSWASRCGIASRRGVNGCGRYSRCWPVRRAAGRSKRPCPLLVRSS